MNESLYQSKSQIKRMEKQVEAASFIKEKQQQAIEDRWEQAQMKAATMQSVLDFAVDQFNQHKDELEIEMITKTEEQIKERQDQIKDFVMSEKELYLASIGIQQD